jgi:ribosomal protein S18 acetylase RimI-like enzyme
VTAMPDRRRMDCVPVRTRGVQAAQGLGVGRQLLQAVGDELGPRVTLVLASMPQALGFYEKIGMPRLADAFQYRRQG